jgi:hypothetical protein
LFRHCHLMVYLSEECSLETTRKPSLNNIWCYYYYLATPEVYRSWGV